jgi:GTPase Era involved in 16S rRNA processing
MKILFKEGFNTLKEQLQESIESLHQLTQDIGHESLDETVREILERIHDPFLFVIVGEVKAGKSSFINALLGSKEEICKVAASPMTDTIQQIVYGKESQIIDINPYLKRITQPIDILKDIAIVDTPGTNTIVDHHQEITERFIPHSDLIVFVFESKNPYRQSAWEFFDYINEEWHKKIIFVLQQKDLMVPADLVVNTKGVTDYAIQKGISNPNVYAVSAKMEQEDNADSGFDSLKTYIQNNITGGKAPFLKLKNNAVTADNINDKIAQSIDLRTEQWQLDKEFRDDIKETLETQKTKTEKQIDFLVENLLASYDRITRETETKLSSELSFLPLLRRSISSIMGSKKGPKEHLEKLTSDFEKDLNIALKDRLQSGVIDIADNIQTMAKLVDSKIKTSKTVLKDSDEIFADIADKRANVLKDLQQTFNQFMEKSENFYDKGLMSETENMAPNMAAGGGIAIVGIILASVVNGAVFDITGGILTTIGILFAGVTVGFKRRKIMSGFREEIAKGRKQLEVEVTEKLKEYTAGIKQKIDNNFTAFDEHLGKEEEKLSRLNTLKEEIKTSLSSIKTKIEKHL